MRDGIRFRSDKRGFHVLAPLALSCVLVLWIWGVASAEPPASDPAPVGYPRASEMMVLLEQEMAAGLKQRRIEANFGRFRSYAARTLDNTAGRRGSEVTGNCRLSWYDHMMRDPLKAPGEAEQFTRELHQAVVGDHEGLDRALGIARTKMDLDQRPPSTFTPVGSPEAALEAVTTALTGAQLAHNKALAPLSRSEIKQLADGLYPMLTTRPSVGHTVSGRSTGRRLCDLLEKLDRNAIYTAAESLVPLSNPELLKQLAALPEEGNVTVDGATGTITRQITTPAGKIVIGGRGKNTYQLDKMQAVNVVIDLGGDDVYYEGSVSLARPLLIVIDLQGDDAYRGTKPGVQGSAVLGISMLLDVAGNDVYDAKNVAQGSCLGGAGILIDYAGNDSYRGVRRVQGQAIGGLGILIDRAGHDRYHAAMWDQGFGGPLGFGLLDDLDGNDRYYTGGLYPDSYPETPGYEGWGQGVGAGLRGVANGGLGMILDGGGDDVYEYDYIAHGGGYWLGVGFARDFGGDDQRLAATSKAFNGSARRERRYQRLGTGFGCHYTLGFCFDDQGDDSYHGTIMSLGYAWDLSVGALCDFAGNDRYEAAGGGTQGNGAQAGLGILFDCQGDDYYRGYGQGRATSSISYHNLPQCGGNFSFVVDYGGEDKYGCGAKNNSYNRRYTSGGFLIDRAINKSDGQETAESGSAETPAGS